MDTLKTKVAKAALEYMDEHRIIGVGTGSTVNHFITELAGIKHRLDACVASSIATEERLRSYGIPVIELNVASEVPIYFDGADEVDEQYRTIKGGGGALTREKIIATEARTFICMVEERKVVQQLGAFPIAVEVLPMARSFVARALVQLGGEPVYREGWVTDNGNILLDVYGLDVHDPIYMEQAINAIPGVLENGIFARRLANRVLVASVDGVRSF